MICDRESSLGTTVKAGPDDRLAAAGLQALRSCSYHALANLKVEARDGVLVVSGVVHRFYLKQVAQAVLARLPGVRGVRNRVQVCPALDGSPP